MKKICNTWLLSLVAWVAVLPISMAQAVERDSVATSPYAQVVPGGPSAGGFYTFLAFTHPSLSTATSQIQLTVSYEGPADNLFLPSADRSETFTVAAGETHKVFIVGSNHPSINPTTQTFFGSRDHFITTTESSFTQGNVRVITTNATPTVQVGTGTYNNLNQISMWGVIFHESNSAGFAMEFIGDMHDSTIPTNGTGAGAVTVTTGRGIN